MADKERFKISKWNIVAGKPNGAPFQAMLNPSGYEIARQAKASKDGAADGCIEETLTLEDLVLDGTGVVASPTGVPQSVEQQLADLLAIVQIKRIGQTTVYPMVQLVWGALYFVGRVRRVGTKFTLFAPDGTPLRARVSLSVEEYVPANNTKPARETAAMSKQLSVDAGVRLPELCFATYNDPGMAAALARYNNLTSMRNVPAGTTLATPPKV